jgi:hypothetical protein
MNKSWKDLLFLRIADEINPYQGANRQYLELVLTLQVQTLNS